MSPEPPSHHSEDENLNQTDADLYLRMQNGETNALAILYDRHAALVYGIALHLLTNTTWNIFRNLVYLALMGYISSTLFTVKYFDIGKWGIGGLGDNLI